MPRIKKKEALLRSKDAAHILDCCPDDVLDLRRKGELKGKKRGLYWGFRLADVVAYKKKMEK